MADQVRMSKPMACAPEEFWQRLDADRAQLLARAETAEAEVERLRQALRDAALHIKLEVSLMNGYAVDVDMDNVISLIEQALGETVSDD